MENKPKKRSKANNAVRSTIFMHSMIVMAEMFIKTAQTDHYQTMTLNLHEMNLLNRLVRRKSKGQMNLENDAAFNKKINQLLDKYQTNEK